MTDLIKELRECERDGSNDPMSPEHWRTWIGKILSRHEQEEPLAVLADRRGYWKVGFVRSCDSMAEYYWTCNIQKTSFDIRIDKQRDFDFVAPTYAECEAKARAYLNGLPDKTANSNEGRG